MTTIVEPSAIDAYVAAVEHALGPALLVEHRELVEDLVEHLNELATEEGDALADRLGSPEAYAAELLASAGIAAAPVGERSLRQRWSDLVALRRAMGERVGAQRFAEFRSGWWVLRAWAVVALVTVVNSDNRDLYPIPDVLGNPLLNVVALGGAVAGSVWVGHRASWRTTLLSAVGVLGLVVAVAEGSDGHVVYTQDHYGTSYGILTGPEGQYIQNIWPFDGAGNPIEGVYLFDQDGNPISVGNQGDPAQVNIPGLFPQQQPGIYADGSTVQQPPVVSIPKVPAGPEGVTTTVPAPTASEPDAEVGTPTTAGAATTP